MARDILPVNSDVLGSSTPAVVLPFQPDHAYKAGEVATFGGITYTRNANGISRSAFDVTELAFWTPLPFNRAVELAYAERTTAFTATNVSQQDVPGLSITVTEGVRPYYVEFGCYFLGGSVAGQSVFAMISQPDNTILTTAAIVVPITNGGGSQGCKARITPTSVGNQRTFKVQTFGGGTAIPKIDAVTTGKAFLRAFEA